MVKVGGIADNILLSINIKLFFSLKEHRPENVLLICYRGNRLGEMKEEV